MATILFENANIFDGHSSDLLTDCSVLVADGVIREISDRPIKSKSAEIVDCTGKTLMPGLIDNHVHVYIHSPQLSLPEPPITFRAQYANQFLRAALMAGFTTVRDVGGGDHGMAMALRRGWVLGPRYFYGGLCLSQSGGHGDLRSADHEESYCECSGHRNVFAVCVDGEDECRKAARNELRKGASHIKIMASGGVLSESDPLECSQYSEGEIRAIVDECSRRGAYVCAHCHPAEAIRRCVEYGVRCIEHGTLIDRETAELVARAGAFVVPTTSIIHVIARDADSIGLSSASRDKLKKVKSHALSALSIMKDAGVKMGFGTDLLGEQNMLRGLEFTLRGEVLTSFDILQSATSINAAILGMDGKLGTIREGAYADLLVIDGNPLENIGLLSDNGRHIPLIVLNGQIVKH